MLYMIIERFNGNEISVYERARDRGRMLPDGLQYVSSWVSSDFSRCFQVMETHNASLLDEWIARWEDIVDFEVVPVQTSAEAAKSIERKLDNT
jgi:hypothetical protein